jgi:glycosyltransferase involved in cell wall biosynthesis
VKILYHHRILAKDGMDVHVQEMVSAFRRRGHQVLLVGPRESRQGNAGKISRTSTVIRQTIPVVSEFAELAYNGIAYNRLKRAWASFQPDILYERYNLYLLAGLWLTRARRLPMLLEVNAPLALERAEHGRLAWRQLARSCEAKVWRGADVVLPVSEALADIVQKVGVAEDRIHVIPNGVDLSSFVSSPDSAKLRRELKLENRTVLGFVGFVRPWHGLDRIIEILANCGHMLDLHLLIVGDGPARPNLEQMANELGVADRVQFVGAVGRRDVPRYVEVFDIALQPSAVAYACPLKLIEYMSMGKAIIAPDQPNIRELIGNSQTGLLVRKGDTRELTEAILLLANNPELRVSLGRRALEAVRQRNLTWDANAEHVSALATQMSQDNRRRPSIRNRGLRNDRTQLFH